MSGGPRRAREEEPAPAGAAGRAEILRATCAAAREAARADRATCYVVSGDLVVSEVVTTEDDPGSRAVLQEAVGRGPDRFRLWELLLAEETALLAVEDVEREGHLPRPVARRLAMASFVAVRLEHPSDARDGRPALLGALCCSYRAPRPITPAERTAARALAGLAALALASARRHAEAVRALALAEERAETDVLTGLPNRRAFDRRLEAAVGAAGRTGRRLSALVLDLDRFKELNDLHGHATGDLALAAVAEALRAELRPGDVAARLGGEEFAVLLPESDAEAALTVAERLRSRIGSIGLVPSGGLSASVGIASLPEHAPSGTALMQAADRAMYTAKALGRDRSMVFRPGGP